MINKENEHERDKRIVFIEDTHTYFVDGKANYISATTVKKPYFGTFDADETIDKWQWLWNKKPEHKLHGLTREQIKAKWGEAAPLGTAMHLAIELYLNGEDSLDLSNKELRQFYDWLKTKPDWEPYRTEWSVFDEEHKIAGQIDSIFRIKQPDGSYKYVMADWKRTPHDISADSKAYSQCAFPLQHLGQNDYWGYGFQQNMYKYILEKYYDIKIEAMYLIRLHEEVSEYGEFKCPDMQDEIKLVLKHRNGELNETEDLNDFLGVYEAESWKNGEVRK